MRIGVDGRELAGRRTGVGRYLAELLTEWRLLSDAHRHTFVIYRPTTTGDGDVRSESAMVASGSPYVETRWVTGGTGTWWEQISLPAAIRRDALDVLFAPGSTAPLATRVPIALTIHDVSFLAHPEWFSPRERIRRRWLTRGSARAARVVLTVSNFSKDEIVTRLGLSATRVLVIPNGFATPVSWSATAGGGDRPGRARTAPPPPGASPDRRQEPLVLFVGSIFNRRRLPDLIEAFSRLARAHPHVRLEIVGDNRTYPRQDLAALADAADLTGRVGIRSYVDDATLADLYGRARVFAFLSEYEGFGLTPLEALAAGVPILVLDTPAAREVYGDAALYVEPGNIDGVAAGLRALLLDETTRAKILCQAPAVLTRYSWARAAQATLAAIERAAS